MHEPADLDLCRYQPDLAAEIAGWAQSIDEARAWCGRNQESFPEASLFAQWPQDPDTRPYVLHALSIPVVYGEICVDESAGECEVARLVVKPTVRGRGIGRRLAEELAAVATTFGLDVAFIRVLPENEPALACYRRAGFERVTASDETQFNTGQPTAYVGLRRCLSGRG